MKEQLFLGGNIILINVMWDIRDKIRICMKKVIEILQNIGFCKHCKER